MAVCGLVPVAAIVLVVLAGTYRHHRWTTTVAAETHCRKSREQGCLHVWRDTLSLLWGDHKGLLRQGNTQCFWSPSLRSSTPTLRKPEGAARYIDLWPRYVANILSKHCSHSNYSVLGSSRAEEPRQSQELSSSGSHKCFGQDQTPAPPFFRCEAAMARSYCSASWVYAAGQHLCQRCIHLTPATTTGSPSYGRRYVRFVNMQKM